MRKISFLVVFIVLLLVTPVQAKDFNVTLTWNTNTESDLAGYRVYRSETTGTYTQPIADLGLVTTYTDTLSVPDGQIKTFYYVVTAFDQMGLESNYSNEVNSIFDGNTSPGPVQNLQIQVQVIVKVDVLSNGELVVSTVK